MSVAVLAKQPREGAWLCRLLGGAGIPAQCADDVGDICDRFGDTAALLVAEERLEGESIRRLRAAMECQPTWSDLPLLVVVPSRARAAGRRSRCHDLVPACNPVLLDRPLRSPTVLSAVRCAVAARRRQYEIRGLLAERDRADEHQALLLEELNHRVRNILAVIVSLATQTMRRSRSMAEFGEAFTGRLHALSRAHGLLTRSNWTTATIADLAQETLAPYEAPPPGGRVRIRGDATEVSPRTAQALGLLLHELATNAAKYGALTGSGGVVDLSWRIEETAGSGRRLAVEWCEHGGPVVPPRGRRGFGTVLIEQTVRSELKGRIETAFEPAGFRCRLDIPWPPPD